MGHVSVSLCGPDIRALQKATITTLAITTLAITILAITTLAITTLAITTLAITTACGCCPRRCQPRQSRSPCYRAHLYEIAARCPNSGRDLFQSRHVCASVKDLTIIMTAGLVAQVKMWTGIVASIN